MIKKEKTVDLFHFNELEYKSQLSWIRKIMDHYSTWIIEDDLEKQWLIARNLLQKIKDDWILFYKDWKSFHTEWSLIKNICKKFF